MGVAAAVDLMQRKPLMMRKGNRHSDQLSNKSSCARAFIGYVRKLPHPFTTWFAEFSRWHEPDGF
jgi:hypothetical protein